MVNHQPESPISWVKCLKQHLFFPSRTYTGQTSKSNLAEPDEEQKVRFDHDQWTNHDNHDWLVINLRWVFQMILAKGAIPNNQSSQQQNAPTFRVSQPTPTFFWYDNFMKPSMPEPSRTSQMWRCLWLNLHHLGSARLMWIW